MSALGIDIKLLFAQIINFVLFFLLVKKFIAKPFLTYLHEQKKIAEEKEEALKILQNKEKELDEKTKEVMKRARQEAIDLQNAVKKDLATVRAKELKKIQEEIAYMKQKAEKQISEDKKKMISEVRKYIVDISATLVKKALSNYLDETKQKEVLQYIIRDASKTN